jgi:hypothetical protein
MSFIYCHLNFHANLLRPWSFPLTLHEQFFSYISLGLNTYMPTLERLKAVGGGSGGFAPPKKMFFSEGCKMVHSAAFWI